MSQTFRLFRFKSMQTKLRVLVFSWDRTEVTNGIAPMWVVTYTSYIVIKRRSISTIDIDWRMIRKTENTYDAKTDWILSQFSYFDPNLTPLAKAKELITKSLKFQRCKEEVSKGETPNLNHNRAVNKTQIFYYLMTNHR